ncbi:MAG: flagellar biosynthesis protein FlgA, partial [SAR324 cluster bacterium]|nr:flagellar biosynthesis protein FlgA [SAR324 cluster bacterium]
TLKAGEMLDGEGGYTVWGKLLPAPTSLERRALPLGLAHHVKVIRDVPEGDTVTWNDVEMDTSFKAYSIRKEFEKAFS